MPVAYVLAKIEVGQEKQALERAKKLAGVKAANLTYGAFDLHIEIQFDTMEELDEIIFEKIRKLSGVKETLTLVVPFKRV
jgi:DNA-binding Lrp family transcriptional regulator